MKDSSGCGRWQRPLAPTFVTLLVATAVGALAPGSAAHAETMVEWQNKHTGYCLQVLPTGHVVAGQCGLAQDWIRRQVGDFFTYTDWFTSDCLQGTVSTVVMAKCGTTANQQWRETPQATGSEIRNVATNSCLDTPAAEVFLLPCSGSDSQRWNYYQPPPPAVVGGAHDDARQP
jgi:hypothetical protein